jgi:hypothetical protein
MIPYEVTHPVSMGSSIFDKNKLKNIAKFMQAHEKLKKQ